MPTVATPEYALVTAAPAALGAAVEASMALGFAPVGIPYVAGANLEQVMFKGASASFIAEYAITAVVQDITAPYAGSFTIAGDQTANFNPGYRFTVTRSTGNNGVYTVVSSVYGASTVITVKEAVPSAVADGFVEAYAASVGP